MDFSLSVALVLLDFNVIRNCTQRSLYCLLTRNQRQQREQFRRKVEVNQTPKGWSKIYSPRHFQPQLLPRHPFLFLFLFPFPLHYLILCPNPWSLLHSFRRESVTFTWMWNDNFEIVFQSEIVNKTSNILECRPHIKWRFTLWRDNFKCMRYNVGLLPRVRFVCMQLMAAN